MTRILTGGYERGDMYPHVTRYQLGSSDESHVVESPAPNSGIYAGEFHGRDSAIIIMPYVVMDYYLSFMYYENNTNEPAGILDGMGVFGTNGVFSITRGYSPEHTSNRVLEVSKGSRIWDDYLGIGTIELQNKTWHLIEMYWKNRRAADGRCVIKVDGVIDIDFTGNTVRDVEDCTGTYSLYCPDGLYGGPHRIDDLAINDTLGDVDNSWIGRIRNSASAFAGDGLLSEFIGSDGNSVDNYTLVNERPPSSSQMISEFEGNGKKQYFVPASFDLSDKAIKRVWVELIARKQLGSSILNVGLLPPGGEEQLDAVPVDLYTYNSNTGWWSEYNVTSTPYYATNPHTGLEWGEEINSTQIVMEIP